MESHPADVIRCRVQRHQQPDDAADRSPRLSIFGRNTKRQGNSWIGFGWSWGRGRTNPKTSFSASHRLIYKIQRKLNRFL